MPYRVSLISSNAARMTELRTCFEQKPQLDVLYWQEEDPIWMNLPAGSDVDGFVVDLQWQQPESYKKLQALHDQQPHIPILALIPYGNTECAEQVMSHGASDFLMLPLFANQLCTRLRGLLRQKELQEEVQRLTALKLPMLYLDDITPRSVSLRRIWEISQEMATQVAPLAVCGEDGVGREMLARAIHSNSEQRFGPLISVNLHHLSESDIRERLFGGKGHACALTRSQGGTLLIRGLESAPLHLCRELVSRLREGEQTPRVIFIVDKDKRETALPDTYRVFESLSLVTMFVPRLCVMKEDIAPLAQSLCHRFAMMEGKNIQSISPDALRLIQEHEWPGNLREFSEAMFKAVNACRRHELSVEDFSHVLYPDSPNVALMASSNNKAIATMSAADARKMVYTQEDGTLKPLDDLEKELITFAMDYCNGHISQAARYLGIGRSTLYRKLADI